jgi:hypothetical protein
MATRYGYETLCWLVERGWKAAPLDNEIIGDQHTIDPVTGEEMTVYRAAEIPKERTGASYELPG